jgi:hypothetical protein
MAHAARVTVDNPGPARAKSRTRRSTKVMAKKRRRRTKKRNPTKRRSHARKRTAAAPVKRRRRTTHRRKTASNPRHKRRVRRAHARRRAPNPGKFRKKGRARRHSRRNPGLGDYKPALIGVAAAIAAFVGVQAVSYYATPTDATSDKRNKTTMAVAGAAVLGGIYLLKKRPTIGVAVAAGGLLSAFGTWFIFKALALLPPKAVKMGAVAYDNMRGYELGQLGAVAYDNLQGYELGQLGAVAYDNMQGMGSPVPAAPWDSPTPF